MKKLKVIKVEDESIEFDNGVTLFSSHESDCCESHYLSFNDIPLSDFDGLKFDLSKDDFFKKVEGYGIELIPVKGHPVRVPGYGSNNGYYSTNLTLCIQGEGVDKSFDITECQEIND